MKIVTKVAYNRIPQLKDKARRQAREIVWDTALEIERDTKKAMEGPKHGRLYRRGAIKRRYKVGGKGWQKWKGVGAKGRLVGGRVEVTTGYNVHRSSAPGEAPAVDLGKLRNSYEAEMVSAEGAAVFSNAAYAARQELGGSDSRGINIAKRPALKPSAEAAMPRFYKRIFTMLHDLEK